MTQCTPGTDQLSKKVSFSFPSLLAITRHLGLKMSITIMIHRAKGRSLKLFPQNFRSWQATGNLDKTDINFILLLHYFTYFSPPVLLTDLSLTRRDRVTPPSRGDRTMF